MHTLQFRLLPCDHLFCNMVILFFEPEYMLLVYRLPEDEVEKKPKYRQKEEY